MADWRDGPEYAPSDRPGDFEPPADAVPLASAPRDESPPDAPAALPAFGAPDDAVPLDRLQAAAEGPRRDPAVAFEVASAPVAAAPPGMPGGPGAAVVPGGPGAAGMPGGPGPATQPLQLSSSAWGAVHAPQAAPRPPTAWAPQQPLALPDQPVAGSPPPGPPFPPPQVNPQAFPPPDAQQWYAPHQLQQPPASQPVTVGQMWNAATPGVMICLILGVLVGALAVPLMFIAHALASRVLYRRRSVENAFKIVEGGTALLALLTTYSYYGFFDLPLFWEQWHGWAQAGNGFLAVVVMLAVGAGLRAGEQPGRRYP